MASASLIANRNNSALLPSVNEEAHTGTTIMAVACQDGVVLGADTRVSTGTYVANRTSDKIAQLSEHIFCCRSGSAADTQFLTEVVKHHLEQLAIQTGRIPRVVTAAHLMQDFCYRYKDNLSAGVIVAGWDPVDGGSVYNIPAGGMSIQVPFSLGGSGSLFIYGLVDATYQENMTLEETKAFVQKSVSHAMARDGSSGGSIRTLCVQKSGNVREYVPGDALPFGPTGF